MKRKNKKGNFGRKIRNIIIIGMVGFVAGGLYLNSGAVGNQAEVYSDLKAKYGITVQTEPDAIESDNTSSTTSSERNLTLTVDSDLRIASNVSAEEIDTMLSGTALEGLGEAFVEAEKTYGVNALYMMGLAIIESGWGTSDFAVNRNNLYGWNAVDSNPGKATTFKSKKEATLFVASKLKANYLTKGGAYHEGFSARSIDVHYCTDTKHADKIISVVSELTKKLS